MSEDRKKEKMEKARALFTSGANCSQAVLGAFHEECGISMEMAMKIASGFGGGMARMREVCGTVSGMFLAADLIFGSPDVEDKSKKDALYKRLQALAEKFRQENSSIICRELLGLTQTVKGPDSPVSEPRTPRYYKKRPCADLVADAAGILADELYGSQAD